MINTEKHTKIVDLQVLLPYQSLLNGSWKSVINKKITKVINFNGKIPQCKNDIQEE